ncbi:MAG: GNAT family N-acetyltransferase [Streptosporangiales bacterium]|nr:GNAT family N-acetyltransferase [Streptosporangiales bacterium]
MTAATFPQARIVAERVVLRSFGPADVTDVRRACSDELVQRWTSVPCPYTDEHARAWCRKIAPQIRESGDGVAFAVADPLTDRFLASIDLKNTNWWTRVTEVGYLAAPWARGRGLTAEAVRALARWLFTEQAFERLELRAATGNHASRRVAEKAGFTCEGVLRSAGLVKAGRVDHAVYSLVRGDLR